MGLNLSRQEPIPTKPTLNESPTNTLTFKDWLEEVSPSFTWTWAHLAFMRQKLEEIERGDIPGKKHLMINCPPRHGKSEQNTIRWPVYLLEKNPTKRVAIAAYNQRLANKFSRKARKIAQNRLHLSQDRSAVEEWETEEGGSFRAVGRGGGITGDGVHWLLIDDPIKSRKDADSDTERETVWNWFTDDLYTRLEPGGHIVLTVTRWHEDDLAGRIKASEFVDEWEIVNLPALAEENDPLGRLPDQALCPDRYDEKALAAIKRVLDEEFDSLYQGNPTRAAGNIFKRIWMNKRYDPTFLPTFFSKVQTVDSSFKTGVGNDYSVIATWAASDTDYFLLDIWRDKVEMPDLLTAIKDQYGKWHPGAVLIEDAASGQSAIQTLNRTSRIPIVPYDVNDKGSKVARAEGVAPLFRIDKVQLPQGQDCDWIDEWIKEHCGFPNAAHDDQVDTTSMALDYLSGDNDFGDIDPSVRNAILRLPGY